MKQIIDFLGQLRDHNNREWFNAHKMEYLACKARFDEFALQLVEAIRSFDDSIKPMSINDCTYRIYRDTRFSQDKRPYKTHMGVFVCPGGKRSPYSGYYFQVGPDSVGYDSGCMLATGNYYCEPQVLKLLREDIADDDAGVFYKALEEASAFSLDTDSQLKRVPKGFDPANPRAELLRLRNFCLFRNETPEFMLAPDLINRVTELFKTTKPFLDLINRAVEFSLEK